MQAVAGRLIFSASDLSDFLACAHLPLLDRAAALGGPKPPKYDDPALEVLRARGHEHERRYLEERQSDPALRVVEIAAPDWELPDAERYERAVEETREAMHAGADLIYQACLFDGTWLGRPDFLERVDRPSDLGDWSYEVVDTKLARSAKGGALLQILLYADLLEREQGVEPEHVHLALAGPHARTESFRVADYAAYFRSVRRRFVDLVAAPPEQVPRAPDPVQHCDICDWRARCDAERREVDHLSLVAGISRRQRRALVEDGVATVDALGRLPLTASPRLEGVSDGALKKIREQARIQVEGRLAGEPRHELLSPVVEGEGLAALPTPSPGDLFLDLEGDPYALGDGLEYLFGFTDARGEYTGWWALDRASERAAFERFIDLAMERLEATPDFHIYHYASYEASALKRLAGRYATREDELDRLLRAGVFVDLHRVVRQGLRASVESYSIKKLEPFYGYVREVDLRNASSALAHFEAWLELGGADEERRDALLAQIEGYNKDDCVSTLRLREWLEELRRDLELELGDPLPRPSPGDPEPGEALGEQQAEVAELVARLTADVPADPDERSPDQHARWILAHLLDFYRRENKATWWEYFRCLDLNAEEMIEDRSTLGGLEYAGVVAEVKRSLVHRYRFPHQEHGLTEGAGAHDRATGKPAGEIVALDDIAGTIDLKRGRNSEVPHPRALVPLDLVSDVELRGSLLRIARATLEHGLSPANPYRAAVALLLREHPRAGQEPSAPGAPGVALKQPGENTLDAACRLVGALDRTVLPIQGPPGAGKTYTGAHMILRALEAGMRVGVTATSHKVIGNLLTEVCEQADKLGVAVSGIQKVKDDEQRCGDGRIAATRNNGAVLDALTAWTAQLAAGTAWLWSRGEMTGSVDLLFIDEAGQFSLANTLAVAPAAGSLVLLGDPRQLEQPQQGVHPPGTGVSALEHLLAGAETMPSERGLFLEHTYRLHPAICAFTSELFYDRRLEPQEHLHRQLLHAPPPLGGTGLRLVPVEHQGNTSESLEEVGAVRRVFESLLEGGATWTTMKGETRPIGIADILVIAPYNAQVRALSEKLPQGARVGTVDKFQGQQAPIVIYSMATSSADEAPRGMDFLYSPNRLNVATSRARCVAVVVASPELFVPDCRDPKQMRLANAFCRFRELAVEVVV